jgi:hypothetical protein
MNICPRNYRYSGASDQDAVKGTKVARYMLKTMKIRDLRAD